MSTQW